MTWNVLYGGAGREELIGAVVRQLGPDIAIFTEACATASFDALADVIGPHRAFSGTSRDRECVAIVSRWPIVRSAWIGPRWAPRKWVIATVQPFGTAVNVVGVHLSPQLLWPFELLRVYEISVLLKRLGEGVPYIVAGDFNALSAGDGHQLNRAPSWVRAQLLIQAGMMPRPALRRFLDAGYIDCYRARNPRRDGFTAPSWDPQARIDYVFASRELASALSAADVGEPAVHHTAKANPRRSLAQLLGRAPISSLQGEASDHLPVWADFEWGNVR